MGHQRCEPNWASSCRRQLHLNLFDDPNGPHLNKRHVDDVPDDTCLVLGLVLLWFESQEQRKEKEGKWITEMPYSNGWYHALSVYSNCKGLFCFITPKKQNHHIRIRFWLTISSFSTGWLGHHHPNMTNLPSTNLSPFHPSILTSTLDVGAFW